MNAHIKAQGLAVRRPVQGEVLMSGDDYSVTILSDDNGSYPALNDYSIVLKVRIGKVSFLLMADAEKTTESQLLSEGIDLDCDYLQVGHHGNRNGETEAFLDAVTPLVSVISFGRNPFGQPFGSVIGRLKDAGSSVYRTDYGGTVTVITDGETSRIELSAI
jgi:beta-lactamase superfamily II metal-dependent hydrolase